MTTDKADHGAAMEPADRVARKVEVLGPHQTSVYERILARAHIEQGRELAALRVCNNENRNINCELSDALSALRSRVERVATGMREMADDSEHPFNTLYRGWADELEGKKP